MGLDEIKNNLNQLKPSTALGLGFSAAFLALCTIGFFVMLVLLANGKLVGRGIVTAVNEPANVNANSDQPPGTQDLTGPAGEVKAVTDRDHVRGAKNAKVTLIEYSDFECPYCKRFHETLKQVMAEYQDRVKLVYRHWALSFHANAKKEAEATECAYELGGHDKFWQFANAIYERTQSGGTGFALTDLPKLAVELGLNQARFETCLNGGKYGSFVDQSGQDAQTAGISGTPGIIIVDARGEKKIIKGALPLDMMKQVIDAAF